MLAYNVSYETLKMYVIARFLKRGARVFIYSIFLSPANLKVSTMGAKIP